MNIAHDGNSGGLLHWLIDFAASAVAAAAVACSMRLAGLPAESWVMAAAPALLAAYLLLRRVRPEAARYRLRRFEALPWSAALAESRCAASARVVTLFPSGRPRSGPAPLPGQPGGNVVRLAPDASAALRNALAELKR